MGLNINKLKIEIMNRIIWLFSLLIMFSVGQKAIAFCGFYVAKAGATLFNNRSEVILVRDGERTVITMSNDFKGNVKDFAMVVPVPVVLQENQIRIANRNLFAKLDEYSGPRLVEYYDSNPCMPVFEYDMEEVSKSLFSNIPMAMNADMGSMELGVTIEAQYQIGEYDILILSAKESEGLKTWLIGNGCNIPATANEVLDPYIKSNMKFFVVKVNLEKSLEAGFDYLSPIQIEFNHDRFMLPIRLGMANANGAQDMVVYAFTRSGRIETTNYRTVKIPTDRNIPLFVEPRFGPFYKALFDKAYESEGKNAVFLEYAWNVSPSWGVKCDPCVGNPPIFNDFTEAGVNWIDQWGGSTVFFTRLHVRYTRDKFPQDLFFQVTPNQENFQGRYILSNPAEGDLSCDAGQNYLKDLEMKRKREIDELVSLTGWEDRYGSNYVLQYSNQIKNREKRNELLPVVNIDLPRGGGGLGIWIWLLFAGLITSAFYIAKRFRPVLA